MNATDLLRHYGRIADAPDAIARLRRFVLNLAVRGKLVPQDSSDESASIALGRISREIQNGKPFDVQVEPAAFMIREGWSWVAFGRLIVSSDAGWSPKTEDRPRTGSEWGVLKVSAVSWGRFQPAENKQVLPGATPREQAKVRQGDFLISRANTAELVARAVIVQEEPINLMMSDKIVRLHLSSHCNKNYLLIVNNYADFAREHYARQASGVSPSMKNVSRGVILSLPIPLPPLAEQHRIVAKVDELMALCDQLERARTKREDARDRLAAASLARLNGPDHKASHADGHFALDALPAITTRPDQIKQLRQTIRNLAVRGRLVTHHPSDEPSRVLLARIAEQGKGARSQNKRTGTRAASASADVEPIYQIPESWSWARFVDVASIESNLVNPNEYRSSPHIAPDNIQSGTGRLLPFGTVGSSGVFSSKHLFKAGCLLYSKIRPALAKVVIVDFDGLCSADMYPLRALIHARYLQEFMLSVFFVKQSVAEDNRVAMPKINQESLSRILVAVPPLAEQHRIVAKVDELMALCDQLEASLTAAAATRSRLLDALLHEALLPALDQAA